MMVYCWFREEKLVSISQLNLNLIQFQHVNMSLNWFQVSLTWLLLIEI